MELCYSVRKSGQSSVCLSALQLEVLACIFRKIFEHTYNEPISKCNETVGDDNETVIEHKKRGQRGKSTNLNDHLHRRQLRCFERIVALSVKTRILSFVLCVEKK